ncbi:MAG: ferredoxin family protein [Myxococcota bacterium]|nr:ferredoxin family protein [Myxococcota bacterium]
MSHNAIVRQEAGCDGCGVCVAACPQLVYAPASRGEPPRLAHPERCFGCLACEEECPRRVLRVHRLPAGMSLAELPPPGLGLDRERPYDLVVVGAGPAGLGAALRGRALGLTVAVLDRLPSPRRAHHPDGGLLISAPDLYRLTDTGHGLRLAELDLQLPADLVVEELTDFWFAGPSGQRTARHGRTDVRFPVIDKDRFVEALAAAAVDRGATLAWNTRACEIGPPDPDGLRRVALADGGEVVARVVVAAEGIGGWLAEAAGLPVNARTQAWSVAPYVSLPPLARPTGEAGFAVGEGPGRAPGELLPYLAYLSTGPHATHVSAGPLITERFPRATRPSTTVLADFAAQDPLLCGLLGERPDLAAGHVDGCRVRLREVPGTFVGPSLIAVGDTITTCGMITNVLALKTGDLAAQVAAAALREGGATAARLAGYGRQVRKLSIFRGLPWMSSLLCAGLELPRPRLDRLFDLLRPLPLGLVQAGRVAPLVRFYLRILPTLLRDRELRRFLIP